MKVAHVIVGLEVGGAELMLARLVEAHQRLGRWQQAVISLTSTGPVGARIRESSGVEVHALGARGAAGALLSLGRLAGLLRRWGPDVVQTWMYHADLLGGLAARLVGTPVVWGIRSTEIAGGNAATTTWIRRLNARLSGRLPAAIVCAAETSRRAHVAVGYDAGRMVVVPNGFALPAPVDPGRREALRRGAGLEPGHVAIGSVGRFNPDKDHETFVGAAARVHARCPEARFVLIGRHVEASTAPLRAWIEASGCAEAFVLLGERRDVPDWLGALDVFCLHSRTEGFPNALGEAMAAGLPVVTTDVGDAATLAGPAGVVVPPGQAEALAAALQRLVHAGPSARAEAGRRARDRIEQTYSLEQTRDRFDAVWTRVANES